MVMLSFSSSTGSASLPPLDRSPDTFVDLVTPNSTLQAEDRRVVVACTAFANITNDRHACVRELLWLVCQCVCVTIIIREVASAKLESQVLNLFAKIISSFYL